MDTLGKALDGELKAIQPKNSTASAQRSRSDAPVVDYPAVMLGSCRVPRKFMGATLADFAEPVRLSIEAAFPAEEEYPAGMFICGPCGTGKTHLAAAILRMTLESGFAYPERESYRGGPVERNLSARFQTVPDLLMELRASFGNEGISTEWWIVQEHRRYRMLVLDDLGAERVTDFSLASLYLILSKRVDEERCTIVTSNLSLKELHAWDPRIASRLASLRTITLAGKDRRLEVPHWSGRV
jgi:DNA replication protein DnaC